MAAYAVKLEFAFLTDLHELLLQKGIVNVIFVLQVFMNIPEKGLEKDRILTCTSPGTALGSFRRAFLLRWSL